MSPRLREWLEALGDAFWLRPALVVAACVLLAETADDPAERGRRLARRPHSIAGNARARAAEVETRPERRAALRRHADLALAAGRAGTDAAALADLEARRRAFPDAA